MPEVIYFGIDKLEHLYPAIYVQLFRDEFQDHVGT